jgi:predicted dehydrogenase
VKTRVAVVGCGAFGRQHARVYSRLADAELAGVFDANPDRARAVAQEFGTASLGSLEEVAGSAQAASVAVPTAQHLAVAEALLSSGLDLLVEKPIASSVAEADRIVTAANHNGRILQVGHLERFNPAVKLVMPRVTRPLFFEVHRLSVFTARSLDVDVVLDLMIHDLDIVLGMVKSPIVEVRAVGLPVLSPRVDIANVRMAFANGCVANFTASRVSTEKVRKLRFFQPGDYVSLDYTRQDAHVFSLVKHGAQPRIEHEHLAGPAEEPLEAELRDFIACVRARRAPLVGGAEGRGALRAAELVNEEIARHAAGLALL